MYALYKLSINEPGYHITCTKVRKRLVENTSPVAVRRGGRGRGGD
jgi:hypothetical protein